MRPPTLLATIDRTARFHARERARHHRRFDRTHAPDAHRMELYHQGALDALDRIRRDCPDRVTVAYRSR